MNGIKILYKGKLRTIVTHTLTGEIIETDAPIDNNGKGEKFSPTDLQRFLNVLILFLANSFFAFPKLLLSGSNVEKKTDLIFCFLIISVQGSVFPWWLHGSSVEYSTESLKLIFLLDRAILSACGRPLKFVCAKLINILFFTITHPTAGFSPEFPNTLPA